MGFRKVAAAAVMSMLAAPAGAGGWGNATFFGNIQDSTSVTQLFRFYNGSRFAGTATMALYNAATGTSLGTWTSPSIPPGGAIEISASGLFAAITVPAGTGAFNAVASASFRGTVRQITRTSTAVLNQTDCGTPVASLSYVEGPGFPGVTAAVKIMNPGLRAGTVTFSLRNAGTGAELGRWTSASVSPRASVIVSVASMASQATPVVPATTQALTIVPVAATSNFGLEHLASITGSSVVSNLTDACTI